LALVLLVVVQVERMISARRQALQTQVVVVVE
jgi:hypothetical protein